MSSKLFFRIANLVNSANSPIPTLISVFKNGRKMMYIGNKLSLLLCSAVMAVGVVASSALARPVFYSAIISNNTSLPASTSIGLATYTTSTSGQVNWTQGAATSLPYATNQKTIGARKQDAVIMYRDATNGNINVIKPIVNGGLQNISILDLSSQEINIFLPNYSPFNLPVEEIEIDPVSGDVFALTVTGSSRSMYRINRQTQIATLMTLYNGTVISPNGTKLYWNTMTGQYQNGSITFVPNPQNPSENLLAFTHESNIPRYRLCTWFLKPVGDNLVGMPTMNRCWGTSTPGAPLLSTLLPGTGLNTTYIKDIGKLVIARDNGPLMELDWNGSSPPSTIKPLNGDGTSPTMNLSNDLAYWYNQ